MKRIILFILIFTLTLHCVEAQSSKRKQSGANQCLSPTELQKQFDKKSNMSQSLIDKVERIKKRKLRDWGVIDESGFPITSSIPGPISRIVREVTIPVIVHVIHHGEPVGEYSNVSEEDVNAAINHMNYHFNNILPSPTFPPSVNVRIKFCLATVDESGNHLYERGIERIEADAAWIYPTPASPPMYPDGTTQEQIFIPTINDVVIPSTIWNPTQYLNIWTINAPTGGHTPFFGYTFFPEAPLLSGIDLPPNDVTSIANVFSTMTVDGVVVMASTMKSIEFGSMPHPATASFPELIYTQTGDILIHEVGHWLGLRHVTGDGGCAVDDGCADTERCSNLDRDCTHPAQCGELNYPNENFMSYSNEDCMDELTTCQRQRMGKAITNDPMRRKLAESPGCKNPTCFIYPEYEFTYDEITGELQLIENSRYAQGGGILYSRFRVTDLNTGNSHGAFSFGGANPSIINIPNGNLLEVCHTVVAKDSYGARCWDTVCDTLRLCNYDPIFNFAYDDSTSDVVDVTLTNIATNLPSSYTVIYENLVTYDDCSEISTSYIGDVASYSIDEISPVTGSEFIGLLITMTITNNLSGCSVSQTYGIGSDCLDYYYPTYPYIPGVNRMAQEKRQFPMSKENQNEIELYPNPTSDILNVRGIENIQTLMILDIQGKQFQVESSSSAKEINVSSLPNGVYWLKVIDEKGNSYNKKFVKLK